MQQQNVNFRNSDLDGYETISPLLLCKRISMHFFSPSVKRLRQLLCRTVSADVILACTYCESVTGPLGWVIFSGSIKVVLHSNII